MLGLRASSVLRGIAMMLVTQVGTLSTFGLNFIAADGEGTVANYTSSE